MSVLGRRLRYALMWGIFCLVFVLTDACNQSKADSTTADGVIASPEPDWSQWRGPRRDGICEAKGLLPGWPDGGPAKLWKIDGLGTGWSSPIVVNGRMFVTGDVGDDLVVFAFDRDGRLLWRSTNGRAWKGSFPGARASCTFSEGRLYRLSTSGESVTPEHVWSSRLDTVTGCVKTDRVFPPKTAASALRLTMSGYNGAA